MYILYIYISFIYPQKVIRKMMGSFFESTVVLCVPKVAEARLSDFRAESPPRARYMLELLEGEAGYCQGPSGNWAKGNFQRLQWFLVYFSFGLKHVETIIWTSMIPSNVKMDSNNYNFEIDIMYLFELWQNQVENDVHFAILPVSLPYNISIWVDCLPGCCPVATMEMLFWILLSLGNLTEKGAVMRSIAQVMNSLNHGIPIEAASELGPQPTGVTGNCWQRAHCRGFRGLELSCVPIPSMSSAFQQLESFSPKQRANVCVCVPIWRNRDVFLAPKKS